MGAGEGENGGFASCDEKQQIRRRRSQLKTPQSVVAGFPSGHQGIGFGGGRREGGGVGLARQIRGVSDGNGGQHSSFPFGGEGGDPMRLGPVKPKGKSRFVHLAIMCSSNCQNGI